MTIFVSNLKRRHASSAHTTLSAAKQMEKKKKSNRNDEAEEEGGTCCTNVNISPHLPYRYYILTVCWKRSAIDCKASYACISPGAIDHFQCNKKQNEPKAANTSNLVFKLSVVYLIFSRKTIETFLVPNDNNRRERWSCGTTMESGNDDDMHKNHSFIVRISSRFCLDETM